MSNQGTIRLKVTNGAPAIEKLWNGRFKLEFFCDNNSPREDWYYENVSALLPEYGILQATNFGSGVSEDWEAIPDSVYPDMRLVLAEYPYNVRSGKHYVKLTYETLTASWVEEKDEDTDYELNGLKRVSRTFVALPATTYDKVVGTSTIDSGGTTLYLGGFKIEKTEAKWELTEVWLEAGTLSETLDNVGSQKAKVIETIGTDPATPNGYSLASKQESDFEGFQTNRFKFLKNNVVLDRSIQTKNGGKLILEVVEVFNGTPVADTVGAVQIGNDVSNIEGIPTRRFTFAKGDGQISVDRKPASTQLAGCTYVTVRSLGTPVTPTGVLISESETESDGFVTYEKTALQGTITGVKQTYTDVADVEVPGEVDCTTEDISIADGVIGNIVGTIAIPKVQPRRSKKVAATVKVEITTLPPSTASLAYDLGQISCSVTSVSKNYTSRNGPTNYVKVGIFKNPYTDWQRSYTPSARIQVYPGCFLTTASSNGTVSYKSQKTYVFEADNDGDGYYDGIDSTIESNASSTTSCIGQGSTSNDGYVTTGILRRDSRPVLTSLDGTTYYEVITWSV